MRNWLLSGLLLASASQADIAIGPVHGVFDSNRIESETGIQVRLSANDTYMWASYEKPHVQLMGQNLGAIRLIGSGVGAQLELNKDWNFFAEVGYFWSDESTTELIRDEAVEAKLKQDFGKPPFKADNTSYFVKNSYGGRVGVSYEVSKHIKTSIAYRVLALDEGYDLWKGPLENRSLECGCWWQERHSLNMNAFEIGLFATF